MTLASELSEVKGIGPALTKQFNAAGLATVADLINYYPRRYEDYSKLVKISELRPGPVSLRAVIKQAKGRYLRRGLHLTEAIASDDSGSVRLVWFNQPYRAAALKKDRPYYISGQYELGRGR